MLIRPKWDSKRQEWQLCSVDYPSIVVRGKTIKEAEKLLALAIAVDGQQGMKDHDFNAIVTAAIIATAGTAVATLLFYLSR